MAAKTAPAGIRTVYRDDPPDFVATDEDEDVVISASILREYLAINWNRPLVVRASGFPEATRKDLLASKRFTETVLLRCDELTAYLAAGDAVAPVLAAISRGRPDLVLEELALLEQIVGAQARLDSLQPPLMVHRAFVRRDGPYAGPAAESATPPP